MHPQPRGFSQNVSIIEWLFRVEHKFYVHDKETCTLALIFNNLKYKKQAQKLVSTMFCVLTVELLGYSGQESRESSKKMIPKMLILVQTKMKPKRKSLPYLVKIFLKTLGSSGQYVQQKINVNTMKCNNLIKVSKYAQADFYCQKRIINPTTKYIN